MYEFFNKTFNKKIIALSPGDIYSTEEDVIVQTVLGSCISVCLYTDEYDLVGMNHFMLPGSIDPDNFHMSFGGRYGMYAMDSLIGEFVKKGIKKENLKSKVFGGSSLLKIGVNRENISSQNIKFIVNFLNKENIAIISSHLGGDKPRKILFFTKTRKVLLKEIKPQNKETIYKKENDYKENIINQNKKIIFFD